MIPPPPPARAPAGQIAALATPVAGNDDDSDDDAPSPSTPRRLTRQNSSELRRAGQINGQMNPPAFVRQTSEEMVDRFQTMISWEKSDHPIVNFKCRYGEVQVNKDCYCSLGLLKKSFRFSWAGCRHFKHEPPVCGQILPSGKNARFPQTNRI